MTWFLEFVLVELECQVHVGHVQLVQSSWVVGKAVGSGCGSLRSTTTNRHDDTVDVSESSWRF